MLESILDEIPQLGSARRASLLERFGSVAAIRKATVEDIAATPGIGSKIASIIDSHLSSIVIQRINTETGEIVENK
jgi:excinuclease ABC subunit C